MTRPEFKNALIAMGIDNVLAFDLGTTHRLLCAAIAGYTVDTAIDGKGNVSAATEKSLRLLQSVLAAGTAEHGDGFILDYVKQHYLPVAISLGKAAYRRHNGAVPKKRQESNRKKTSAIRLKNHANVTRAFSSRHRKSTTNK